MSIQFDSYFANEIVAIFYSTPFRKIKLDSQDKIDMFVHFFQTIDKEEYIQKDRLMGGLMIELHTKSKIYYMNCFRNRFSIEDTYYRTTADCSSFIRELFQAT